MKIKHFYHRKIYLYKNYKLISSAVGTPISAVLPSSIGLKTSKAITHCITHNCHELLATPGAVLTITGLLSLRTMYCFRPTYAII